MKDYIEDRKDEIDVAKWLEDFITHPMYQYIYNEWLAKLIDELINEMCKLQPGANEVIYTASDVRKLYLKFLRDFQQNPILTIRQVCPDLEVLTTLPPK